MEVTVSSIVARDGRLIEAAVHSEIVLMDGETGECYSLNEVAARVWTLIAQPMSVGAICADLEIQYEVTAAQCRDEVLALLDDLHQDRLIVLSEGAWLPAEGA